MIRYAAFLRGVNLGNRRLRMDELRRHLEGLGLEAVRTFLASGNAVFDHERADSGGLETAIEEHLARELDFEVDTFVREMAELERLSGLEIAVSGRDAGFRPHVVFLREVAGEDTVARLSDLGSDDDRFHVLGREVLWLRRGRLSDAPFTTRDVEKALGRMPNTMRNLNTVDRMVARFG